MVDSDPGGQHPPGRASLGMREMIGAMLVLLVIIGAVLAFTKGCSFSPGGPSVDPSAAPRVDAERELRVAATSTTFPVRLPDLPSGWRANSASTDPVGAGASANVVVRVGWLTPAGSYAQLSQSGGVAAEVLAEEIGREGLEPTGSVDVAGVRWTSYPGRRAEQAWVTEADGAVLLVTGSAGEADLRTLATAAQSAAPLPR